MVKALALGFTISIHALREEGDKCAVVRFEVNVLISIHALREEGDLAVGVQVDGGRGFLSTPSARRATGPGRGPGKGQRISIHALREEGDAVKARTESGGNYFYPRPPRGGRRKLKPIHDYYKRFLSTPSARRATFDGFGGHGKVDDFYPRPPRGGRPL